MFLVLKFRDRKRATRRNIDVARIRNTETAFFSSERRSGNRALPLSIPSVDLFGVVIVKRAFATRLDQFLSLFLPIADPRS